jgi:hypothetical protein
MESFFDIISVEVIDDRGSMDAWRDLSKTFFLF